jgi:tRNA A37 threonylcarbamoyladenosine synthetase subunit TsaC/SUA5/YrdC
VLTDASSPVIRHTLEAGGVVGLPGTGGYVLAAKADSPAAEARLSYPTDQAECPQYTVGAREAVRGLTSDWNDELGVLLDRCWPGPLEVVVSADVNAGSESLRIATPVSRTLRRLCRDTGPWRSVPVGAPDAPTTARLFDWIDVVLDGGRLDRPPATLVDATRSPFRVLRDGALPAAFVEGALLMGARRGLLSRFRHLRR